MERIYHPYWLWEDYKAGFYDTPQKSKRDSFLTESIKLLSSDALCYEFMKKAIDDWPYSCEHNFTNPSMNRIAYLGQAACCIYSGCPNVVTMEAWKMISKEVRDNADKIALKVLRQWASKERLTDTLRSGSLKGMKTGYQMRLQLN